MDDFLTIHAPLTAERRAALHKRLLLCVPLSAAEAEVFGKGVELLPALIGAAKAELAKLGGDPEAAAQIDAAAHIAAMVLEACQRSFFAGTLSTPEVRSVQ